jgi:hypothetical protein
MLFQAACIVVGFVTAKGMGELLVHILTRGRYSGTILAKPTQIN